MHINLGREQTRSVHALTENPDHWVTFEILLTRLLPTY